MKQTMKKAAAGILAVMVLAAGATSAFAAGSGHGRNYADANRDGICDYAESACRYLDADNDGVCDYCGGSGLSGTCHGEHFVDSDGDGICDYAGSHFHHFDSDGDGIYDRCGNENSAGANADGVGGHHGTGQAKRHHGGRNR